MLTSGLPSDTMPNYNLIPTQQESVGSLWKSSSSELLFPFLIINVEAAPLTELKQPEERKQCA